MLNPKDILKKQIITKDFEIVYLKQETMQNWKKTWKKTFSSIDKERLLEKILKNKIFSFYCTDTNPVLLWIGINCQSGPIVSENKCFFIEKNNFLDCMDELKFGKKKLNWTQQGF